jgi:2,3-bisphosphoglycerate-independent phosphoglycerate mutase
VQRDALGAPVVRPSHSLNPVPFVLCDARGALRLREVSEPGIAHIGPTVLALLGVDPPDDFLPALV